MSEVRRATVRVPGSSANLGAGFDCIGLAVDRWLQASVEVSEGGRPELAIEHRGTLCDVKASLANDLLIVGFEAARRRAGHDRPISINIVATSDIPVARGLGSSAAALVAGAALANESLALGLSRDDIVAITAEVEGHPDNVSAAVFGGAMLGVPTRNHGFRTAPLGVSDKLSFIFASPAFVNETKQARAVLPTQIPYQHAVVAAGKAAALVRGLETGDSGLLSIGLDDVLHVPYRKALIRGFAEVTGAAIVAGAYGGTLSGSGSTLVAISPRARAAAVGQAMQRAWAGMGVESSVLVSGGTVTGYRSVDPTKTGAGTDDRAATTSIV